MLITQTVSWASIADPLAHSPCLQTGSIHNPVTYPSLLIKYYACHLRLQMQQVPCWCEPTPPLKHSYQQQEG